MKSATQFLYLSIIILTSMLAGVVFALIWNRLEPTALALGLILVSGSLWCATKSRKPTRATAKATLFSAIALGGILIVCAVTDLFDLSPSKDRSDLAFGATLAAVLSAIAAPLFAHRALRGNPRVALYLVAGWTALATLIIVMVTKTTTTYPWERVESLAPLAVIPGFIWLFLQDKRRGVHRTALPFEAAALVASVAVFTMSVSGLDLEAKGIGGLLDSGSVGAALGAWLWISRSWLLRRGSAQAALLVAGTACLLILDIGDSGNWLLLHALAAVLIVWAAWRQASHRRSTPVGIALFMATALLVVVGLEVTVVMAVLAVAVIFATCALYQRWRQHRTWFSPRLQGAKSLRVMAYTMMAFACPALLVAVCTLIHWLGANLTPSRAMAQVNLPTKWVVAQALRDDYLWPRPVETSWLTRDSADALIADARIGTPDIWSGIADPHSQEDFHSGTELSAKIEWVRGRDRTFAGYVDEGSPAEAAGIRRGFELVKLRCAETLSERKPGRTRSESLFDCKDGALRGVFRDAAGSNRDITWTLSREASPDVSHKILETSRGAVGYLLLRAFRTSDVPSLIEATRGFEQANVRELVVDLRYNGGGSLGVAMQLASLLAGDRFFGRLLWTVTHNRYNGDLNQEIKFPLVESRLALRRIVFLTGPGTCSASEALIVGLWPHLPVITIGEGTCGKPVGYTPIQTADSDLWLIDSETKNADGVGHYFSGILPDCHIVEDLRSPLGDPNENLLATALTYFQTGKCTQSVKMADRSSVAH